MPLMEVKLAMPGNTVLKQKIGIFSILFFQYFASNRYMYAHFEKYFLHVPTSVFLLYVSTIAQRKEIF